MATRLGFNGAAAILLAATAIGFFPTVAGEWDLSGSVEVESRWFPDDPRFAGQFDGLQASLALMPEFRWRSAERRYHVSIVPFFRLDGQDDERTHGDLREAYFRYVADDWELVAGANKLFWGVTESRHLVDIVNQNDAVEDIDEEDKLGQPMVHLGLQLDWGRVDLLALTGFRERTFPGVDGRPRTPLPVDTDAAVYESGAGAGRTDGVVRWSHFIGDWDVGAYYFNGTSREPRLVPNDSGDRLVPHYDVIGQFGVDLQYTRNAWLWKFEGIVREGQGKTFGAAVAGFEYTRYQVGGSAGDLGLLFEYLRDDRDDSAPDTAFDDDLFAGARWALNDVSGTALLVGAIVDREDGSTAARVEFERRLGDRFRLELDGRMFVNIDEHNDLSVFEQDSFVNLGFVVSF